MEAAAERMVDPVAVAARVHLAAADAEVERPLALRPALGHREPAPPKLWVGEGLERLLGRLPEPSLDGEVVLADAHRSCCPSGSGKASSRTSPRRSSRRAQAARCSLIQLSIVAIGSGSSRQRRTRPTFSLCPRPLR